MIHSTCIGSWVRNWTHNGAFIKGNLLKMLYTQHHKIALKVRDRGPFCTCSLLQFAAANLNSQVDFRFLCLPSAYSFFPSVLLISLVGSFCSYPSPKCFLVGHLGCVWPSKELFTQLPYCSCAVPWIKCLPFESWWLSSLTESEHRISSCSGSVG